MNPLRAVGDANAMIGLAKGGVFDQIVQLFPVFFVPTNVSQEVVVKGQGRPGSSELARALQTWATEVTPDLSVIQQTAPALSVADRAVLAVALAVGADFVLTDDRDLRREAHRLQLACLGIAEVVVLMKERGVITSVRSVLDQMLAARHGIASDVYERALRAAGEWAAP
jgi:predicted nucleic acid-binding protein